MCKNIVDCYLAAGGTGKDETYLDSVIDACPCKILEENCCPEPLARAEAGMVLAQIVQEGNV